MFKSALGALALLAIGTGCLLADTVNSFVQTNLTSDLPGVAAHLDPNLVNPWGIVAGPQTPFWINDNGTGLSTLFKGSGAALPLVVTVPPPTGSASPSAPTGIVFKLHHQFLAARISSSIPKTAPSPLGTPETSATLMATSPAGSVYKGLAAGGSGSADRLYAANFGLGRVDVFDSSFHPTTVAGGFRDSSIPAGYAPFDVKNINGTFVRYLRGAGCRQAR